jgi:EAL domain-containing protein (putative c-di-GMP-specific phosphodiesterase class I)
MQDAESANSVLHALADMGVKIAIDDFGSGYSCLANLKQFPIDTLKIDQSFVSDVISNPDNAIIVSTVISIGKSFNQHIIAEGVETPEQYAFLLAQHCDEGQGYYFSRPLESVAFARLLKTGVPPCFAH